MKRVILSLLAVAVVATVSAQEKKEYPNPEGMRPGMTEFWTPQPKVVKPGDIKTNSAPSDAVVLFDAPEDLLLQRLTARLTCRSCGASFNKLFALPKTEGVCDHCQGELYQRSDDSMETAQNRLKVYHEQTSPLIEFYIGKNLLSKIDSSLPKNEGYAALQAVLS